MKHLFKNEIKHLLNGGTIRGLNINSFMFFLDNLSGKPVRKKVLILTEEPILSHFVRQRGFFKNNLYSLNTPDHGVASALEIVVNNSSNSEHSESSTIPETKLTDVPENLSFENDFQI